MAPGLAPGWLRLFMANIQQYAFGMNCGRLISPRFEFRFEFLFEFWCEFVCCTSTFVYILRVNYFHRSSCADVDGADADGADVDSAGADCVDADGADADGADVDVVDADGADADGADAACFLLA